MAALDDIKTQIARLVADVDTVRAKIDALKAAAGVPEADIQAASDALKTAVDSLEAVAAA